MQSLKAHVRGGRLILDEPTDLPEGEVVELVPVDRQDTEALDESLAVSLEQMRNGELLDGDEVLARLRTRR